MTNRYFSCVKTLVVGAMVGSVTNGLTNIGSYFGEKAIKQVILVLLDQELDDGRGQRLTFNNYPTPKALLERIFKKDLVAEKITTVVDRVYSFAQEEGIPCSCVPLLSLLALQKLNITIIVDDSTSMGCGEGSRWEECKKFVSMVAKYAKTSEESLVTLRFLNQEKSIDLASINDVESLFARNPYGGTPLIKTLETTLADIKKQKEERRNLIYVFTDGVPNDGAYYQPMLTWIRDSFAPDREVSDKVAISFVVADETPSIEKEYRKVDNFVPPDGRELHIDTNLSYKLEQARCNDVALTEGLYKVKLLVGAVNEEFDALNNDKGGKSGDTNFLFLRRSLDTLRDLNSEIILDQKKESLRAIL